MTFGCSIDIYYRTLHFNIRIKDINICCTTFIYFKESTHCMIFKTSAKTIKISMMSQLNKTQRRNLPKHNTSKSYILAYIIIFQ